MLTPTEVVAQFRDYGLDAELREGFPFCPISDTATMRLVLKCCEGMGLGAALMREGAVITPQPGATMHVTAGKTIIPSSYSNPDGLYRGSGAQRIRRD